MLIDWSFVVLKDKRNARLVATEILQSSRQALEIVAAAIYLHNLPGHLKLLLFCQQSISPTVRAPTQLPRIGTLGKHS